MPTFATVVRYAYDLKGFMPIPKHLWFDNIRDSVIFILIVIVMLCLLYYMYLIDKQKFKR